MAKSTLKQISALDAASLLLPWYDDNKRDLPWRRINGRAESAYHTWISEIMLQQTTVASVIPYYQRFIARWPTVADLAQAPLNDVLKEWAGLGYYSRARNLHRCAITVMEQHHGIFPSDLNALLSLPGIGDYTAHAIRAIAYDLPATVVDGNIIRIMARLYGMTEPVNTPSGKKKITALAQTHAPDHRPGDYAQALMDLGAGICTPRNPSCSMCPLSGLCLAYQKGMADSLPVKIKKKAVPTRYAISFIVLAPEGDILLRQRPEKGLLGGLWELPSTPWGNAPVSVEDSLKAAPFDNLAWEKITLKPSLHVFSHFRLLTDAYVGHATTKRNPSSGQWFAPDALPGMATMTRKILDCLDTLPKAFKLGA